MKNSNGSSARFAAIPQELKHLQIYSVNDVTALLGIHRTTLYRAIKAKAFPPQQTITIGCVGWTRATLEAHLGGFTISAK